MTTTPKNWCECKGEALSVGGTTVYLRPGSDHGNCATCGRRQQCATCGGDYNDRAHVILQALSLGTCPGRKSDEEE